MVMVAVPHGRRSNGDGGCASWQKKEWLWWLCLMAEEAMVMVAVPHGRRRNGDGGCASWQKKEW